jgi:hypothetical protein
MEVEFSLIPEDFVAFDEYHVGQRPKRWIFLYLGVIILGVVVASIPVVLLFKEAGIGIVLIIQVTGILTGLMYYLNRQRIATWAVRRQLRQGKNARFLELRKLAISVDGISASSTDSAGMTMWTGVEKIGVTKEHAFFYLSTAQALVLPRRAFANDHEFTDFVETAQRYFEAANKESVPA